MTFNIKSCLIALLVVLGSLVSRANDNNYLLSLSYIDDGGNPKTSFVKLTDKPIVSFSADKLEISVLNMSLSYDCVTSISFVDEATTAIEGNLEAKADSPKIVSFDGNTLKISGIPTHTTVWVYTLEGKMQQREVVGNECSVSISFSNLMRGTYIVKTNSKSFKISKK